MIRKLVKVDSATGDYAELDIVRLKREAQQLLDYIQQHLDPKDDDLGIWKWVVPMCEGVLDGSITEPINFSELPLKYASREGLLPKGFDELYSSFAITVSGTAREIQAIVDVNGVPHTYADFET